jgi:muconolactone D-isomerase
MNNIPSNFQEILVEEKKVVELWKAKGVLEHLYLRDLKNGAVLIFKNVTENEAKDLMTELPLYPLRKNVEYLNLIQQF